MWFVALELARPTPLVLREPIEEMHMSYIKMSIMVMGL